MSWRDTYGGRFLNAADLPKNGLTVVIKAIYEEVVRKGERPKLVAELRDMEKRWVVNATNCELLERLLGSDEPEDWVGPPIGLFNDRTVRGPNGEKGGIRVSEAGVPQKGGKKTGQRRAKEPADDIEDRDDDLEDLDD